MDHRCFSFGKLSFRTGKHKNNLPIDGEQLYQIWKLHCVSTYGMCIQAHVRNDSSRDAVLGVFVLFYIRNERKRLAVIIIDWIGFKFETYLRYGLGSWRHFWSNSSQNNFNFKMITKPYGFEESSMRTRIFQSKAETSCPAIVLWNVLEVYKAGQLTAVYL